MARKAGARLDQAAPIATVDELPNYDAIIFGTPTRFGSMCAQMRNFLDQTGRLWADGSLIGKVGSVQSAAADGDSRRCRTGVLGFLSRQTKIFVYSKNRIF